VYRVAEPELERHSGGQLRDVHALVQHYPDGPRDAEVLLLDPLSGDLFIVTRSLLGRSEAYVNRAPLEADETLERVWEFSFGLDPFSGSTLATAGDVSEDGRWVAIRTYNSAFLWRRDPERPLETAFQSAPCAIPLPSQRQGESFAFARGNTGYFSVSEGVGQSLFWVRRQ
jgi:hypothetical protein